MIGKKSFKIIWWIILFLGITYLFILPKYNSFLIGQVTPLDTAIFLIWIALLLIPLFEEIDIFGVKLKKEIESLKSDLKEQMINLRGEIQNSVSVQAAVNPNLNLYFTSPESMLPNLESTAQDVLKIARRERATWVPVKPDEIQIPDSYRYLFSVRYEIEKELRRINAEIVGSGSESRLISIPTILKTLVQFEKIDPKFFDPIREIYAICSKAIHAELVTDNQTKFVKDLAPEIITYLKSL